MAVSMAKNPSDSISFSLSRILFQNLDSTKVSDDLRYRVDSAHELITICDKFVNDPRFYCMDEVDISFILRDLLLH